MELFWKIAFWLAIAAALCPVWWALLWTIWQGVVRPRMIPQAEIDTLARQMIAKHGRQAACAAFVHEDRAWRYSDTFEQAKWRRVRDIYNAWLITSVYRHCSKARGYARGGVWCRHRPLCRALAP